MNTQELMKIRHKDRFAYLARTNRPELSSHKKPSMAVLLEDGEPLPGSANALYDEIRKFGKGRYCFWFGDIYFSSSDNSDPRANGRSYSVRYAEAELDRPSLNDLRLRTVLLPVYKLLYHPMMPGPVKSFLLEIGYSLDTIRNLGLLFPFWSFFYWLSFIYVIATRRRDRS